MKKKVIKITIALGLFCFTTFSNAQNISFGAKGGLNLASLSGDFETGTEKSMLTGFHFGGFVDIALNDQFSIVPELLYSLRGVNIKFSKSEIFFGDTTFSAVEGNLKLSYIDIPVMATYKLENGLHFELGPYIGILMAADIDSKSTINIPSIPEIVNDTSYSIKEETESTEIGLAFGLGYTLENGLGFSARYSLGLTDIYKDSGDESFKNTVIGISVNYRFGQK